MKEKLKNVTFLRKIVFFIRKEFFIIDYLKDFFFYKKNYMYAKNTKSSVGYNILLQVHSIEKGLMSKKMRPFGKRKISDLSYLLNQFLNCGGSETDYEFIVGINVLRAYVDVYKANGWNHKNYNEYTTANQTILKYQNVENININTININKNYINKFTDFNYKQFVKNRHSVRSYSKRKLSKDDLEYAIECAINSPSACNRQMCKVYYVKDENKKNIIINYGQGFGNFELENANIFIITYDTAAFHFIGERNQGYFNAGLFSMNFVNALHSQGIGSCFVQFGNSKKDENIIKKICGISSSERIAVLVSAGYYEENISAPKSPRKDKKDVFKIIE